MVVEFVSKNPKHFYMSKYSYWIPPKSFGTVSVVQLQLVGLAFKAWNTL